MDPNQKQESSFIKWIKKLGIIGFLFFFIKGLVWLGVFYLAGKGCNAL